MNIKCKTLAVMILVILISISSQILAKANLNIENIDAEKKNKILFLVDSSNSMNFQDDKKFVIEIMKMFVDVSKSTSTELGFISYNDTILKNYPLTVMKNASQRADIIREIDNIQRFGNTDIGLALKNAVDSFHDENDENITNTIILFSDGETDLKRSTTGRTLEDSLNDETYAYKKAIDKKCQIYTIGISKDGLLNKEYLQKIADSAGGKKYEIQNTDNILNIFNTLFEDVTNSKIEVLENLIISEKKQKVSVKIPSKYSEETNILLQSNKKIKGITTDSKEGTYIDTSKTYGSIKIINPTEETMDLTIETEIGEEIKMSIVSYYNIVPAIEALNLEELSKREPTIKGYLINNKDGERVTDESLYTSSEFEINIIEENKKELVKSKMENTGNEFSLKYNNLYGQKVKAFVTMTNTNKTNASYKIKSKEQEILFTNNLPEKKTETDSKINILKSKTEKTLDLNKYFQDIDGDKITISLTNNTDKDIEELGIEITDNNLKVNPKIELDKAIYLTVKDDRGGLLNDSITLNIMPFWIYYRSAFIGIVSIFIILMILYIIFTNKSKKIDKVYEIESNETEIVVDKSLKFNGVRFEGYFLNTLSGREIPILHWNASVLKNKNTVILGDLFSFLDVHENLPESHKMSFEAGNNGQVLFQHDTNCTVTLNNRTLQAGKKFILNYDDKFYIVFEDGVTEIEIRYRRVRKSAMV